MTAADRRDHDGSLRRQRARLEEQLAAAELTGDATDMRRLGRAITDLNEELDINARLHGRAVARERTREEQDRRAHVQRELHQSLEHITDALEGATELDRVFDVAMGGIAHVEAQLRAATNHALSVSGERTAETLNAFDPIKRFRERVALRLRVIGLSVGMPAMVTPADRQQRIATGLEGTTTQFLTIARQAAPPVEDAPDAA